MKAFSSVFLEAARTNNNELCILPRAEFARGKTYRNTVFHLAIEAPP